VAIEFTYTQDRKAQLVVIKRQRGVYALYIEYEVGEEAFHSPPCFAAGVQIPACFMEFLARFLENPYNLARNLRKDSKHWRDA
jgi:hypothetical protein